MSYVDEKIAKITLDNKAFTKNAEDTIKSLERLKQAFNKAGDVKAAKQVQKEMDSLSQSVGKSVQNRNLCCQNLLMYLESRHQI